MIKRIVRIVAFAVYCTGGLLIARQTGNLDLAYVIGWVSGILALAATQLIDITRIR